MLTAVEQRQQELARRFEALAEPHVDELYRLAAAIAGIEDADDVTQEALTEAWRSFGQLRNEELFGRWIRTIVVNRCRNLLRSRRRSVRAISLDSVLPAAAEGNLPHEPGDFASDVAERDRLDRAFDHLALDHRAVLALHYTLDLPMPEVAAILKVPEGTAKSRLHVALSRMRAVLQEEPTA
ncbi:MAG: RNA polymerase sigma factor [Chloroflexi bacterium]|nr:RNA polymerase sigma factor [Chloroflexota bacterium]